MFECNLTVTYLLISVFVCVVLLRGDFLNNYTDSNGIGVLLVDTNLGECIGKRSFQ